MKKISILLIPTLLILSACGGNQSNVSNVSPTPPQNQPNQNQLSQKPNEKLPDDKTSSSSNTISGLIPSTDPQDRLAQINSGKSDPFSSIQAPAVVKVSANQGVSGDTAQSSRAVIRQNNPNQAASTIAKANGTNKLTEQAEQISQEAQQKIEEAQAKLETPKSLEAESIMVSGILDIKGQNVAIVKTPWDRTTRSVKVGDTISDLSGDIKVRVKNIAFAQSQNILWQGGDDSEFTNPDGVVILEQDGQVVRKEVAQLFQTEDDPTENLENTEEQL